MISSRRLRRPMLLWGSSNTQRVGVFSVEYIVPERETHATGTRISKMYNTRYGRQPDARQTGQANSLPFRCW